MTYCPPALAAGLNGHVAPLCAKAVREARIRWHWMQLQRALKAHRAAQSKAS